MRDLSNYERQVRPWGNFERFTLNENSTVKIVTISPNEAFSLQTHGHRGEFWKILSGSGVITVGEVQKAAHPGDQFVVPKGEKHRAEAGTSGLVLLEISFGAFDEQDIIRLEDKYGR